MYLSLGKVAKSSIFYVPCFLILLTKSRFHDFGNALYILLGGVGARYGVMSSLNGSTEWKTETIYRSAKALSNESMKKSNVHVTHFRELKLLAQIFMNHDYLSYKSV